MVWYDPRTWGKKEEKIQAPPITETQRQAAVYQITGGKQGTPSQIFQPAPTPQISYSGGGGGSGVVSEPVQSKLPTIADKMIGSKVVSGKTYELYQAPTGETYIGKEVLTIQEYNPATHALETKQTSVKIQAPSAITSYTPSEFKAPMTWKQSAVSSISNIGFDVGLFLGLKEGGAGAYRKIFEPFEYTSPITKKEEIIITGGDFSQIKYPKMETISGAEYFPSISYGREGAGPFISKYGESAGVAATSFIAPQVAGGYLMFTGIEKLSKGENIAGTLRFAGGTIPLASEMYNIGKPMGDITKIRFEELGKAQTKILGQEVYVTPKGSGYNILMQQKVPYAERVTAISTATKITGEETFSVPIIKSAFTKTIVQDWWTKKPVEILTKFTTAGKGEIVSGGFVIPKGLGGIKYEIQEDITKAVGTGYYAEKVSSIKFLGKTKIIKGEGLTPFTFTGLTQDIKGFYKIAGITPSKARLYPEGKISVLGDISSYGLIKKYPTISESSLIKGGTTQIFKSITPSGFIEEVSKVSSKSVMGKLNYQNIITSKSISGILPVSQLATIQIEKPAIKSKEVFASNLATIQIEKQITQPKQIRLPRTIQIEQPAIKPKQIFGTASFQHQPEAERTRTKLIQDFVSVSKLVTPSPTKTIPEYTPTITIIPFLPKLKFEFEDIMKTRLFKGKQATRYTPSFEAFVFGIKGKQPKGIETGARLRPITKGFKFYNMFKGFNFRRFRL